ncbi:TPA: nucleoside deaminase [Legionella anisa]
MNSKILFFFNSVTTDNTLSNQLSIAQNNSGNPDITDQDKFFLHQTIELSKEAIKHGNYPFAALLVDADGKVLMQCQNTVNTGGNLTEHAEMNLIRAAVKKFDKATLAACTMYTSCQPHAMSLGAMHWAKLGRLIYGLSYENLNKYKDSAGTSNPRDVFALYDTSRIKIAGPALEDEASVPHKGFWNSKKKNTIQNEGLVTRGSELSDSDEQFLKDAIKMSEESVKHGNHPFGAELVDAKGNILLKIENTVNTGHDVTEHAEMNTVTEAVKRFDKSTLATSTLYSSCEPCAMCIGAANLSHIGNVVYGLGHDNLSKYASPVWDPNSGPGKYNCRKINVQFENPSKVKGPFLEDKASIPHMGFWHRKKTTLNDEQLIKDETVEATGPTSSI